MTANPPPGDTRPDQHLSDVVTSDHLLGGRVAYVQPRGGFRAAIDPVLLAAAVPARAGERVLEGGTGAGAALLCLAARIPDIRGLGIDRDPGLVRLAQANAAANARTGLLFAAGDLAASPVGGEFDHALANPPYHAADGTPSPSSAREAAKRSAPNLISEWVEALSRPLRYRGTLTLILPPRLLEPALRAMRDNKAPAECVFPIWPRQAHPARLLLVQGRKHGRSPLILASGLVLHAQSGAFRPEAEFVLRAGGALRLTGG
ncbi:MAG: methyltransferase [Acetobacteraceae bacterium]|jgi:tRNA1Val (adenine37-N6)-methyltransferase